MTAAAEYADIIYEVCFFHLWRQKITVMGRGAEILLPVRDQFREGVIDHRK